MTTTVTLIYLLPTRGFLFLHKTRTRSTETTVLEVSHASCQASWSTTLPNPNPALGGITITTGSWIYLTRTLETTSSTEMMATERSPQSPTDTLSTAGGVPRAAPGVIMTTMGS